LRTYFPRLTALVCMRALQVADLTLPATGLVMEARHVHPSTVTNRGTSEGDLYQCQGETRMVRSAAHGDSTVALV
jgi:hypothetical protein